MITELNTVQGRQEDDWTINVYEVNASAGIVLRPAVVGHRYGIKSITITANDNEKVEILNGTEPFIGPLHLEKGFPWVFNSDDVIYGTRGNALVLKTESEIAVHCLIDGVTDIFVFGVTLLITLNPDIDIEKEMQLIINEVLSRNWK